MNMILAYLAVTAFGALLWAAGTYGVKKVFKDNIFKAVAGLVGLTGFFVTFFGWIAMTVALVNQVISYMQ